MKLLELVCIENDTTDEQNATVGREILAWVRDTIERKINITGKPLAAPAERAAKRPIARFHQIEVREFVELGAGH